VAYPSGSVEVTNLTELYVINITGLTPNTNYSAFFIQGDAQPGYPDLENSNGVIVIPFQTIPLPETEILDINGGLTLESKISLMITFLLILLC